MPPEEEENKDKSSLVPRLPSPPPPSTLPPAPRVKPDRKQALETIFSNLSNEEMNYAWQLIKQHTLHRVAEKPSEPIDPVLQPVLDDIAKAEEYITQGYTVQYPPKALVPLDKGSDEFGVEDILDLFLQRLDPIIKNPKVQDKIADLLGAIADKIESGGK